MTFYLGGFYSIPEGNSRASWYGFSGTPAAMFDGIIQSTGGQPSGSMFASYQPMVVSRLGISSPLIMNAAYVALGNEISVSVTIQVDQDVANSNNQVYFFVCQEGYHGQSNMVVDMLPTEAFTLDSVGQSTIVNRDFTLDASFTEEDLRLIVLVQNTSTKEILQATIATADYAGTLVVDTEPNSVNAPWNLQGPEGLDFTGSGDRTLNMFFPGDYTLTFLDLPVWTTPTDNPQHQTLVDDGQITFTGIYTGGPFIALDDGPINDAGQGQGVALVDYDNDGDLDIHVVNSGTADQLLRNEGNLVFTPAAQGLLADDGAGKSSAWADFNRDGNQDVLLGRNNQADLLLVGDGAGGFQPATCIGVDNDGPATSVSWADYDLDGNLDIYVTQQDQPNLLLHSLGDVGGGFYLFGEVSGLPANDGDGNGADWIDLNGDRRPELFIVNSFSPNTLLINYSIGFDDASNSSGLNSVGNGVGSAWGDYDNDGDLDVYLSHQGSADRIFNNVGDIQFIPLMEPNTTDTGNGRGVVWADFNNDTNLDIYLVRHDETDLFLFGDGQGGFQQVPVGLAEIENPGNAVACGDLDGDGDLDLFITREGSGNILLSNDMAAGNNFFQLNLVGSENQPDAIGAVVLLTAGGITQMRTLSAGGGYLAMNAKSLHFGLGTISLIDDVEIIWPDGTQQYLTNLAVNQFMQVTKGENGPSPVDGDHIQPRVTMLDMAHPNPFNPSTTIGFALAQSGPTRLEIFTVDGRRVRTLVNGHLSAGPHSTIWNGLNENGLAVASGAYFYRLSSADGMVLTGRMALVK